METEEELRAKMNEQTAMIYIISGPRAFKEPLSIKTICGIAKEKNVPAFVDAAAEELSGAEHPSGGWRDLRGVLWREAHARVRRQRGCCWGPRIFARRRFGMRLRTTTGDVR